MGPRRLQAALLLLVIGLLVHGEWCLAAPQFPALTGRVVDNAGLLSAPERQRLTRLLEEHEAQTTNQVVIVTLESLQGYVIEDFGYELGRHWGIGQEGKDNGVLLIVASTERKVRIEVGYGLEGTLTDALSRDIIDTRILPAFRSNNYERGIARGATGILAVLGGTYRRAYQPAVRGSGGRQSSGLMFLTNFPIILFFGVIGMIGIAALFARDESSTGGSGFFSGGGGGGFSGGGGGFSGGGGGFGGGGASGGW